MENERPIEKLLRRYAKKRHDDSTASGLEIHPATRRMLQGEVSREFPKPAAETKTPHASMSWWPRVVWALPVLVVLGVGVWAIVESQTPYGMPDLAMTESASTSKSLESVERNEPLTRPTGTPAALNELAANTLADAEGSRAKDTTSAAGLEEEKAKFDRARGLALNAPAPSVSADAVPAPGVADLDKITQEKAVVGREALARDARADESRELTLRARRAAEEPSAATGARLETVRAQPSTPAENLGAARSFGGKGESASPALAGASRSVTPPSAAAPSLSLSSKSSPAKVEYDQAQSAAPTVVQRFVQTTAVVTSGSLEKKNTSPPAVLDAFQVEQTGNQLRVIDSDGSSYDGSIQFAAGEVLSDTVDETKRTDDFKSKASLAVQQSFREAVPESQVGQNYFFRVTGTNRTLQQPVAFTGNLLVLTNSLPAPETRLTLSPTAKSQFPRGQAAPTLLNSSISGKVQLGRDKEIQINAVPAAR